MTYLTYPHVCAEEGNRKCGGDPNNRWVARKEYLSKYDEYTVVFWVDHKKNARIPRLQNQGIIPSAPLAHREYVKRILDADPNSSLWYDEDDHPFYAQPLHSLGTGKHMVILSMESSLHEGKREKWVAAIEREFRSLKSVALPQWCRVCGDRR